MIEYSVCLISRLDPLRYLFYKPALTGRLMRWLILLTKFDIQYVSQKSIKGRVRNLRLIQTMVITLEGGGGGGNRVMVSFLQI